MANYTDNTYYIGEILITDKTAIATDLTQAITQYEKQILIKLLGYTLYKDLTANPTATKWAAFIAGAEFENSFGNSQTLKWEGLTNTIKQSLCAYYTFYKYMERNSYKQSSIGTIKPKAENASVVSPMMKMVNAWDNMLDLYGRMPVGFNYRNPIVPSTVYNELPSAYNYLLANISDFEDWVFTPIDSTNIFGV